MLRLSASRRCFSQHKQICPARIPKRPPSSSCSPEGRIRRTIITSASESGTHESIHNEDVETNNATKGPGAPYNDPSAFTAETPANPGRTSGDGRRQPRTKGDGANETTRPIEDEPLRGIAPHMVNPMARGPNSGIRQRLDIPYMRPVRYGPQFINVVRKRSRRLDQTERQGRRHRQYRPHLAHVKDVIVASANALLSSGKMVPRAPQLYDFSTIWQHIVDQALWDEGVKEYGATPTDLLRWRNALACRSLFESLPHLFPSLESKQQLYYGQQQKPCPPPGWLLHLLLLYRTHTPQDVAGGLRLAVSTLSNPHVFLLEKWKLGLIALRQICAYNLTTLVHDCITFLLLHPIPTRNRRVAVPPPQQEADVPKPIEGEEGQSGNADDEPDDIQKAITHQAAAGGLPLKQAYTQMKFFLIIEALRQLPPSEVYLTELMRVLKRHEEAGFPLTGFLLNWITSASREYGNEELVVHIVRRMHKDGLRPNLTNLTFFLGVLSESGNLEAVEKILLSITDIVLGTKPGDSSSPSLPERLEQLSTVDPAQWASLSKSLAAYVGAVKSSPGVIDLIQRLRSNTPEWEKPGFLWRAVLEAISHHKATNLDKHLLEGNSPARHGMAASKFGSPELIRVMRANRHALVSVMAQLLRNHQPRVAISLWGRVHRHLEVVDAHVLSVLIRTLERMRRFDVAFGVLCKIAGSPVHPHIQHAVDSLWPWDSVSFRLDDVVFNSLMTDLGKAKRYDVVWQLWSAMGTHFGVRPTSATVSALLTAANYSDVLPSFSSEFAVFRNRLPFAHARTDPIPTPADIADTIIAGLTKEFWDGQPPWRTAQNIFKEILFSNFPGLKDVKSPVSDPKSAFRLFPSRRQSVKREELTTEETFPHLRLQGEIPGTLRWPDVYPTAEAFGFYISLLGRQNLPQEIPLTLAWMKALNIKPLRRSLTLAMMFYDDIGAPPPMLDRLIDQGGGNSGELRRWIEDWVGPKATPRPEEVIRRKQAHLMGGWSWYFEDRARMKQEKEAQQNAQASNMEDGSAEESTREEGREDGVEKSTLERSITEHPDKETPFKSPLNV